MSLGTNVLGELMSWELMSYGELMSGGTNVLDSQNYPKRDDKWNLLIQKVLKAFFH